MGEGLVSSGVERCLYTAKVGGAKPSLVNFHAVKIELIAIFYVMYSNK